MRSIVLIIISGIFLCSSLSGQDSTTILDWSTYFKRIEIADSLYAQKKYAEASRAFSAAFTFNNQDFSAGHRYRAAKAWAMSGEKDSAIVNLHTELSIGYHNYQEFKNEKAFKILRTDPSWNSLVKKVKDNQKKENEKLGKYKLIKPELERILVLDQKYRKHYRETWKQFGEKSKELNALEKKMHKLDKSNLRYVSSVLDSYGWIGRDTIGIEASTALFLVIQHADSATQEKYLPLLRNAVEQKKELPENLALLEDRVRIRRGEKQIYGTQVQCDSNGRNCWVLPIADEKSVDIRRQSVGLRPLAEYLKSFGINYKVPE